MRNIYYLLCAAMLLTACQKEQPGAIADGDALIFNTSMDGLPITQSRAAGIDTDLKTNGFYLAGYHTEGLMATAPAEAYPNVFDHDINDRQVAVPLVQYSGGKFTLKTIKWKLDEASYLNFYGWSQSKPIPTSGVTSSTTGIVDYTKDVIEKGYPWIEIRNADAPADQSDVVGARSIDHRNDAVLSAVDLNFSHLLSKFSFKAKSSTGGNITIRKVAINYAMGKVSKRATYTFNNEVETIGTYSSYAEYHSGTPTLSTTQIIPSGTEIDLGSFLLIPQELEAGDISLEVTYNIWPNQSIEGQDQTKVIPLSALKLEQGKNYLYTLDMKATEITIGAYPTIEPWNLASTSLPLIAGPKGETLLLLDGYDKPYQHTDGKWYWLDRSGYNRHARLEGYYDGMYDPNSRSYTFKNTASNYALVPAFPSTTALSVDVVAQQTPGASGMQKLLDFHQTTNLDQGADRRFWTHMGNLGQTTLYFDVSSEAYSTAGKGRLTYNVSANSHFNKKILWSFQKKDDGAQSIYENASLRAQSITSGSKALGVLETNIIGQNYGGAVSYVKVTGNVASMQEVYDVYKSTSGRFGIEETPNSYLPPVTSGLLICFDGRSGVETINGVRSWRDQISGNHATVPSNVAWTTNYFTFNGGSADNIKLGLPMIIPNDFTLEVVMVGTNATSHGGAPIAFGPNIDAVEGRILLIHANYLDNFIADCPGINADQRFILMPFSWSPYGGMNIQRRIAVRRQYERNTTDKTELFIGPGVVPAGTRDIDKSKSIDISKLVCSTSQFGHFNWQGRLYLVRLYGRALTDEELIANYNHDKLTFGFN